MKQLTYRSLEARDRDLVESWIKDDPEHQTADSAIFTQPAEGRSQIVVEEEGKPVFFATVENVARIHIQFDPKGNPIRTAKTLIMGFKWLVGLLKGRGYQELIFDSRFQPLIRFCEKALGFIKRDQDYSTRL